MTREHTYLPIEKHPMSENLEKLYSDTDYDIVCFGHHHVVHHYHSTKRLFLNPGSLGCNNKPMARYGIIRIMEGNIQVELVEVPYNNLEFLKSYEKYKVPDREFILKIFHGSQMSS